MASQLLSLRHSAVVSRPSPRHTCQCSPRRLVVLRSGNGDDNTQSEEELQRLQEELRRQEVLCSHCHISMAAGQDHHKHRPACILCHHFSPCTHASPMHPACMMHTHAACMLMRRLELPGSAGEGGAGAVQARTD
jgi:hypothetical protein